MTNQVKHPAGPSLHAPSRVEDPVNAHRSRSAGFSFVEVLLVMAMMSVIMGLAVGYLTGMGRVGKMAVARRQLEEVSRQVQNSSMGNKSSFLQFTDGRDEEAGQIVMEAGVSRGVLTMQFESLETASGGRSPSVEGRVKLARHQGRTGNGALFEGGALVFGAEPAFAMTDGLEIEAWVQPRAEGQVLTIVRGSDLQDEMLYRLSLKRDDEGVAYRVHFEVKVREENDTSGVAPLPLQAETRETPVLADGRTWTHILARWDSEGVQLTVGGIDQPLRSGSRRRRRGGDDAGEVRKRMAVPQGGAAGVSISSATRQPFYGVMDSVVIRGVFRSADARFVFPDGLLLMRPSLPLRVEYANGRLVGTGSSDVILWFRDEAHDNDLPLKFTFGRNGTLSAVYTDEKIPQGSRGGDAQGAAASGEGATR